MKKLLLTVMTVMLIIGMSACGNIGAALENGLDQADLEELYEQLHVEELIEQLGLGEMISQMIPDMLPEQTQELPGIPEKAETDPEKLHFKTIGEAMDAADSYAGYGRWSNPEIYAYVFTVDDVPYRLTCEIDEETRKKFDEIDWMDDDEEREKSTLELARTLTVTGEEDLRIYYPSQEVLDSWKGKTGQELADAGFLISGYNNTDFSEYMEVQKGLFIYKAIPNEAFSGPEADHDAEFMEMTLKEISVMQVSNNALDISVTE